MSTRLEEVPSRAGVLAMARRFARPHRLGLCVAVLLGLASTLCVTLAPVSVGRITDALLDGDRDGVLRWGTIAVLVAVAAPCLGVMARSRLAAAGERIVRDLRDEAASRLAHAPLRFIERHRAGELIQRATAEIAALSVFVRESLTQLLMTAATVLVFGIVLGIESWILLLILAVVFLPPSLLVLRRFRSRAAAAFGAEAQAEAEIAADLAETARVRELLREAPPSVGEDRERRSEALNENAVRAQMRTVVLSRWIASTSLIEGVCLAALLFCGTLLVSTGVVSVGIVVTFVLAAVTLFSSFSELVALLGSLEETLTGASRVRQLLEFSEAGTAPSGPVSGRAPAGGALELDGVRFAYDDSPDVLEDITLRIAEGERVGLAGESGAGKSTLALLLAGLYAPDSGSVRCLGKEASSLTPAERQELVALVPQEVHFGEVSLAQELRKVDPSAGRARLEWAFASLGLRDWMQALPEGLETSLGADAPLSAGERQLVALAKVALSRSRVLILDEATSDLDPATAALVERALDGAAEGRTVVVVAHRHESLERVGRVLVVEGGRIREAERGRG